MRVSERKEATIDDAARTELLEYGLVLRMGGADRGLQGDRQVPRVGQHWLA